MKFPFILWLVHALTAFGAETVAWRVPVALVVEGGLNHPAVSRLDEPPGKSAFFKQDDELWDLSRVTKGKIIADPSRLLAAEPEDPFEPPEPHPGLETAQVDFKGDFAVWNTRSRMIIGRGTFAQLSVLADFINLESQPHRISTTFSLRSEGTEKSLTLSTRSGERASARGRGFGVEMVANAYLSNPLGDLTLNVETAGFRINTTTIFRRDKKVRIARWTDGPTEHALFAKCRLITVWGDPVDQVQFVEADGRILPRPRADALKLDGREFPDGLRARVFCLPPAGIGRLFREEAVIHRLTPPARMTPWIPRGLIDLKPAVEPHGVPVGHSGAVVGYDPLKAEVIAVHSPENLEILKQIFTGLEPDTPQMIELEFRWPGGLASIVSPSGYKASLTRFTDDGEPAFLEIAPNFTSSRHWIDSDFNLSPPDGSFTANSSITAVPGKPVVIAAGDQKITLTANLLILAD